jgi:glutaminyl-tRNA synthetase
VLFRFDPSAGTRRVPFSRVLFIERDDFREDPPKKYFRLAPGASVRLRYGYIVTCTGVVRNDAGEVVEVHCEYDPATRSGSDASGRKVKGTIHWVSAAHAVPIEVRLYDRLFLTDNPDAPAPDGRDFTSYLNPDSLTVLRNCLAEPGLAGAAPGSIHQFERLGYFCADSDTAPGAPVFNRTATLRDSWSKLERKSDA